MVYNKGINLKTNLFKHLTAFWNINKKTQLLINRRVESFWYLAFLRLCPKREKPFLSTGILQCTWVDESIMLLYDFEMKDGIIDSIIIFHIVV